VPDHKLAEIVQYVDEFTTSYHTESSDKQKRQFQENLQIIKLSNRKLKCIVLMHNEPDKFADAQRMIEWLKQQEIEMLPRQIDSSSDTFNYNVQQVQWFDSLYQSKSQTPGTPLTATENTDLSDQGRACCGGRQVCENQKYRERTFFTSNKFPGWSCSVNWFFLHIKQVNGQIFVNKDCKMNFNNEVGTIGTLDATDKLLEQLKHDIENRTLPIIQCAKARCLCGLCAPKAKTRELYDSIIVKYQPEYYKERIPQ
jgi:hypothetical protein